MVVAVSGTAAVQPGVAPIEPGVDRPMSRRSRLFAFVVVFVAGWYLCLPETEIAVPWWATKHKFGPNLLIYEAVFAVYLVFGGMRDIARVALPARYATLAASIFLILLAGWCAAASEFGPLPLHDAGRSARLVMMALLLLAVTNWAARDPLFVLRTFLFGLAAGSVVNLVLTFTNPVILAASVLPRLLGQNSPGPPMGMAVCLSAWLIRVSRARRDTVFALVVAAICGVGAMISYSKTGMLAAAMGVTSFAVVSARIAPSRRGGVMAVALLSLLLGSAAYFRTEQGNAMLGGFSVMMEEKLASAQVEESASMQERLSYFKGVGEIMIEYPIGVGYSGFRDAMMRTRAYQTGRAADEGPIPASDSNPHAFVLYYASAGGAVGGVLALLTLVLLCRAILIGLGDYGRSGVLLGVFAVAAYFVLATSISYLLNSGILLIPAAVTAGLHAHLTRGRPRARLQQDHFIVR